MISNKPYILRAMYEWIVDNGWTPHLQVDANYPGVNVPQEFVQEGVIVLNMAPSAVVNLSMDNSWFTFKARFNGVETTLGFAPEAVLAIFARENGQGMPFPPEPYPEELLGGKEEVLKEEPTLSAVADSGSAQKKEVAASKDAETTKKKGSKKKRPTLTVVK